MGLRDRLAKKAITMGRDSSEFSKAAQKYADATWFYLAISGVTWYFFGWILALIPAAFSAYTAFQSASATLIATRLEGQKSNIEVSNTEIVQAYGKTLETNAPTPGAVADVSKLPYTKQQIKSAIIEALRSTEDSQMKEFLKVGYIQLSDWQEGVGEAGQGVDLTQDIENLAKAVLEESFDLDWMPIMHKEQEALIQELKELGLW
ncbi:hypothetical protein HOO14_07560 [bacterium]|jgi:hypothetical protein|nr:hypothetical protein [bacterium]